jgi:hypothetical protein
MALRKVHAFGKVFDLEVLSSGRKLWVSMSQEGGKKVALEIENGETFTF